jgi:hypothetical protein
VAEFGINPSSLVGFISDGAAVMVAAGRELGVIHQKCLGNCCASEPLWFEKLNFSLQQGPPHPQPFQLSRNLKELNLNFFPVLGIRDI